MSADLSGILDLSADTLIARLEADPASAFLDDGDNAQVYAIGGGHDRVLRISPDPDNFLLYAALIAADPAMALNPSAPVIHDIGILAGGGLACLVERLESLDIGGVDVHDMPGLYPRSWAACRNLDRRLRSSLRRAWSAADPDDPDGWTYLIDIQDGNVGYNVMARPAAAGSMETPPPLVLADPLGGMLDRTGLAIVKWNAAAMADRWPSLTATIDRLDARVHEVTPTPDEAPPSPS